MNNIGIYVFYNADLHKALVSGSLNSSVSSNKLVVYLLVFRV